MKNQRIPLSKGKKLPLDFHKEATVGTSQDDYAQVAYDEKKDGMVLINDSKDTWIVINTGKKIGPNEEVKLGGEPLNIVFAPKLKGTVTPTPDAPTPAPEP